MWRTDETCEQGPEKGNRGVRAGQGVLEDRTHEAESRLQGTPGLLLPALRLPTPPLPAPPPHGSRPWELRCHSGDSGAGHSDTARVFVC